MSGSAWLEYDSNTGHLLGIHWSQPSGSSIQISEDEAKEFMFGQKSMIEHRIGNIEVEPILEKLKHEVSAPEFWSLYTLDNAPSSIEIDIKENEILVHIPNGLPSMCMLFATLKNDPTWLIKSWKLYDIVPTNNVIRLYFENATQYSMYVSNAS